MSYSDPILPLIDAALQAHPDAIPEPVLAFQRLRLLDHLACLAAGYDGSGVAAALALARRWSAVGEATVLGSGIRLAAGQAAFVNAVRARALDFCDVISPGWHPSSSDIPVALAMAEHTGASGRELLAALAIGQDVGQRINLAAQANGFFYRGFDSNVLGLLSGAVMAARLLRLPRDAFLSALGLAFDFGIGTFQHYQDKTLAVRIGQGLVARHAIEAAQMAQAGLTGPRRILGGENGFFKLYAPGEPDLALLTADLGQRYLGAEATCFKPYPHCSILLALTDTLLARRGDLPLEKLDACTLRLHVSPTMRMVCGAAYAPSETAEIDAQFSAAYIVANALLRGAATPAQFTAQAAREPAVCALARRVEIIEDPSYTRFDACRLAIDLPSAASVVITASFGRGWPENPLDEAALIRKFMLCCGLSASPALRTGADRIAAEIQALDQAPSVAALVNAMSGPQA